MSCKINNRLRHVCSEVPKFILACVSQQMFHCVHPLLLQTGGCTRHGHFRIRMSVIALKVEQEDNKNITINEMDTK